MAFLHFFICILSHVIASHCYILPSINDFYSNNKLSWSQAESLCLSTYNTHLLTFHEQSILTNIQHDLKDISLQNCSNLKFWIGLLVINTDDNSEYIWIDGSNFDFDFTIHIKPDYSNTLKQSNTNTNTSINAHPKYVTLQLNNNDLIYTISDGSQDQFWICNDKPTKQPKKTTSLAISISLFTVIGILATTCCCVVLCLYAISMKAMKPNIPKEAPHQQHNKYSNDGISVHVDITPENSQNTPELPTNSTVIVPKVMSNSVTSITSHSPHKTSTIHSPSNRSTTPSMRNIMSEMIMERVQSQSSRNRLSVQNSISNVSAGTSIKSGYIETKINSQNCKSQNKSKKHIITVHEHKFENNKRTFLFNANSTQSNNSIDECQEGYMKTGVECLKTNGNIRNNMSNVSFNDNSYADTLDLDDYDSKNTNNTKIREYNLQISRNKKRVDHKTKNSDGYILNDANANKNEKDPLDLGNNEFIVREKSDSGLKLKEFEHSTSIGTVGTVLEQYKIKTNDSASIYLD